MKKSPGNKTWAFLFNQNKNDYKDKEAQMKNTVEVINNLTDELANLSAKIGSLESFLVSKDYQEISGKQEILLAQQRTAMEQYKEILLKRLVDLRCQEHQEEEAAKEYTAQHKIPKQAPEAESGTPTD